MKPLKGHKKLGWAHCWTSRKQRRVLRWIAQEANATASRVTNPQFRTAVMLTEPTPSRSLIESSLWRNIQPVNWRASRKHGAASARTPTVSVSDVARILPSSD